MDAEILFCDNHLLAVVKPAGLVTQPSEHHPISLEDCAKAWVKEEYNKPGNVFLEAVHRLDRQVGGVVLFARTSKALSRLNELQRKRQIHKEYIAVVEGRVGQKKGELRHWLTHGSHRAKVVKEGKGKEAVLRFEQLAQHGSLTLLTIQLETGRYHQIRAQLSAMGFPIVGDTRYGASKPLAHEVIALHHRCMRPVHAVQKEAVEFVAEQPDHEPWRYFGAFR